MIQDILNLVNMRPPLHEQVLKSDMDGIRALIANGADLNQLDHLGHAPLHWAVMRGDIETVRILLEAGADPNTLSGDGITPKWSAVDFGLEDIVNLLTEYKGKTATGEGFDNSSWSVFKGALGEQLPEEE
jgi:ankyrin repeat protein